MRAHRSLGSLRSLNRFLVKALAISRCPHPLLETCSEMHRWPEPLAPRGCRGEPPTGARLAHPPAGLLGEQGPRARAHTGWAAGGGSGGQTPCLASRPGHLLSSCVCSASRERKQDAFRWALGVLGLGGQLLGLAASLRPCLLPSLHLPLSPTCPAGNNPPHDLTRAWEKAGGPAGVRGTNTGKAPGSWASGPVGPPRERGPLWRHPSPSRALLHAAPAFCHVTRYLLAFCRKGAPVTPRLPLIRH